MKRIFIIGGTMGVGKTTVCQILKEKLQNSVFLDGDWCWDMHPFQVTDETKAMVMDNICHQLNNFIHCSAYKHVIFGWVMHEQPIIDAILASIDTAQCQVTVISLVCGKEALTQRLQKDVDNGIRQEDVIQRSIARLPLYDKLSTIKVDVTQSSPEQAAELILQLA